MRANLNFCGTGTQTISGSTTFYNFSCTTLNKTLIFEANSTQTIQGQLTLIGAAAAPIKLRSSQEGRQWNIACLGLRYIKYVDVKDSNNIGTPITTLNSIDSGNNLNWLFLDNLIATQTTTVTTTQPPEKPKEETEAPEINFSEEISSEQKPETQKEPEVKQEKETEK